MLNLVKDLFVFCCYTGMAPVDLQHLRPHQIYSESSGTTWLIYIRKKSEIVSNVPLLVQALFLVKKYEMKRGDLFRETVFPFVTNKDLNLQLKVISELCEVGFPLNFYTARHTFASTIALANGVQVTSIKAMMGHSKIESTLQYARVDKSILRSEIVSLQEKIDLLQ